jgi:hypothetical protein
VSKQLGISRVALACKELAQTVCIMIGRSVKKIAEDKDGSDRDLVRECT